MFNINNNAITFIYYIEEITAVVLLFNNNHSVLFLCN